MSPEALITGVQLVETLPGNLNFGFSFSLTLYLCVFLTTVVALGCSYISMNESLLKKRLLFASLLCLCVGHCVSVVWNFSSVCV